VATSNKLRRTRSFSAKKPKQPSKKTKAGTKKSRERRDVRGPRNGDEIAREGNEIEDA
jgi:hypothetical protein